MNYKLHASEAEDDDSPFDEEAENEHLERMGGDDDDDGVDADHEEDEDEDLDAAEGDGRKPDDENEDDEDEDGDKPEPQKGESKPAFQKRIDRITRRRREAEEEADRQRERADRAEAEAAGLREFGTTASAENLKSREEKVNTDLEAAIEAGNTKEQVKLQGELARISAQKLAMENYQDRVKRQKEAKPAEQQQRQEQPAKGRARFIPEARGWYDRNAKWFDAPDRDIERAAVKALDAKLTEEGFDLTDPDRYVELDKRLAAKFPDLYRKGDSTRRGQKGRQKVAGADRDGGGGGGGDGGGGEGARRQVLTDDNKRLMRRFNLDPTNATHVKEFRRQQRKR